MKSKPGFSQLWMFSFLIITLPVIKLDYAKIIGDVVWDAMQY